MVVQRRTKCKGPRVWIPSGIDVEQFGLRADGARWLLGTIFRKNMYGQCDAEDFARLDSRILSDVLGKRAWPVLRDGLVKSDVVETSPHVAGLRCRGYRLAEIGDEDPQRWLLVEPGLVERLHKRRVEYQRAQDARLLPVHYRLRDIQKLLTVTDDIDMAIDGLPNVRTRAIQRALVSAIREQRPGFTVGTTGRVFDGITGMKRELRQYVRLDGDPIRGVDIRSAQPALLAELLRGTKQAADIKYPSTELKGVSTCSMYLLLSVSFSRLQVDQCHPTWLFQFFERLPLLGRLLESDVDDFCDAVHAGRLYETLLALCDEAGVKIASKWDRRDWAKRQFVAQILNATPADRYRPLLRAVRQRWPSLVQFIWAVNAKSRALVRVLQRCESALVIENVAKRLVPRIPVVPVHDAIYCRASDIGIVRAVFTETFDELRLPFQTKDE